MDGDEALKTAPLGHRWLYGVTRVLALLLGEDTEPRSAAECAFAASTITFGVFGLAVVVGQVTLAAQQLDALGRKRTEQVDAVLLYLRYRDVPADVRREIVRFIDYMWQSGQAEHDTAGLEALPDSLKLRLDLALKQRLIAKVPLFEDLPVTGVVAVVRALRALVAIPGEVVVHEGHEGARRRGDPRRPRLRGARPWAARTRVRGPPGRESVGRPDASPWAAPDSPSEYQRGTPRRGRDPPSNDGGSEDAPSRCPSKFWRRSEWFPRRPRDVLHRVGIGPRHQKAVGDRGRARDVSRRKLLRRNGPTRKGRAHGDHLGHHVLRPLRTTPIVNLARWF